MASIRRIPLHQFLAKARESLQSSLGASAPLHLVTGNESVDLDSFASSVLFAYLSPHHHKPIIPLLPIPRADLNLRPEFLYVLNEINIPPSSLIFLDDIPRDTLHGPPSSSFPSPPHKNEVALVDHNALQEHIFSPHKTTVTAIIDHHVDEGHYPNANPRIITQSGSCSSLVTEHLKPNWPGHNTNSDTNLVEGKTIARLALAAILIDTSNMRRRVTEHDINAVKFLEGKLNQPDKSGSGGGAWDSAEYYKAVNAAKTSLDGLSLRDILRKDYKEWQTTNTNPNQNPSRTRPLLIGISSSVKPISYLLSRTLPKPNSASSFLSTWKSWADERKIDVAAIMTSYVNDKGVYTRELMVWVVNDGEEASDFMGNFEKWANSEGQLELTRLEVQGIEGELEDGERGKRKAWRQGNVNRSRKEVAPGMRGC